MAPGCRTGLRRVVVVMSSAADVPSARRARSGHVLVEELARRQGVRTVSLEELAHPEFFASDEEHDEFLRELRRWRRGDSA